MIVFLFYGAVRTHLAVQSKRASEMLHDLQSVKLGDSESSVLSLSQKYAGYREVPNLSGSLHDETDSEYLLSVDPWRFNVDADHAGTVDRAIQTASTGFAPRLRRGIGFRRWSVNGRIGFRQGHVAAITATELVEGSNEWLGAISHLVGKVPENAIQRFVTQPGVPWPEMNRYLIGWTYENFSKADGAGEAAEIWITPSATQEEKQSAFQLNLHCLTSLSGCRTVCDFVPGASQYAKRGTWAERKEACSGPRPDRYR